MNILNYVVSERHINGVPSDASSSYTSAKMIYLRMKLRFGGVWGLYTS